jgi:dTMP kinase
MKGQLIVVEGLGGSGKTSVLDRMEMQLQQANVPYIRTREPGGTFAAEYLRKLCREGIPDNPGKLDPMTVALLFNAARSENIKDVIKPALAAGKVVLCDRFCDATFAFQHEAGLKNLLDLHLAAHGDFFPDLTFLLDGDPAIFQRRITPEEMASDQFDSMGMEKLNIARKNFVNLTKFRIHDGRYVLVNAEVNQNQVYAQILPDLMGVIDRMKQRPDPVPAPTLDQLLELSQKSTKMLEGLVETYTPTDRPAVSIKD